MIIFRPEKFGSIAFNTENAHELHLDQELSNLFVRALQTGKYRDCAGLEKVFKELAVKKFDHKILPSKINLQRPDFPFPVLSAPVLADINITNRCNLHCPHCYVNSGRFGKDMALADFLSALDQCAAAGVLQIALGGGEPTLHPHFGTFLKEIRRRDIVPNITSNGKDLKWKTVYALARYAGAVALSIEEYGEKFEQRRNFPFRNFLKSVKKLKAAGIKLVFQITISQGNLSRINELAVQLLKYRPYGIIFLAYKPQGRGKNYDLPIARADQAIVNAVFKRLFRDLKGKTKIGFDCCLTPALIDAGKTLEVIGCSAGRASMAIMPDLTVLPCSFLHDYQREDLRKKTLLEIWRSEYFNDFLRKIEKNMQEPICDLCPKKQICLAGCPIFKLANCAQIAERQ